MRKIISILILSFIAFSTGAIGQIKPSKIENLKTKLIALERSGWKAFKNKNANRFRVNTTDNFLSVSSAGISNKEQVVQTTANGCEVKNVSIHDIMFVLLNKETVVLTYIASQDGVCGNEKLAPKARSSATYIKQRGKWLEAFYMETDISE